MEVKLIDNMGDDLRVVNAARVSFNKVASEYTEEQNHKLIHYLAKHKHLSPFGHCFVTFHVKAPVFVRSQLVKHEYLRVNEVSRRYVDTEPEFYIPEVWRGRAKDKKQGSEGEVDLSDKYMWCDKPKYSWDDYTVMEMLGESYERPAILYIRLLELGVSPEMARMVLPQSMYTEWYWSGSLDAFTNMCKLRCAEDTQWETRQVANKVKEILMELYPVSTEALLND